MPALFPTADMDGLSTFNHNVFFYPNRSLGLVSVWGLKFAGNFKDTLD